MANLYGCLGSLPMLIIGIGAGSGSPLSFHWKLSRTLWPESIPFHDFFRENPSEMDFAGWLSDRTALTDSCIVSILSETIIRGRKRATMSPFLHVNLLLMPMASSGVFAPFSFSRNSLWEIIWRTALPSAVALIVVACIIKMLWMKKSADQLLTFRVTSGPIVMLAWRHIYNFITVNLPLFWVRTSRINSSPARCRRSYTNRSFNPQYMRISC